MLLMMLIDEHPRQAWSKLKQNQVWPHRQLGSVSQCAHVRGQRSLSDLL